MSQEITVPVLLIIFNRPEFTRKALDAIDKVKPRTLLVAADGPRTPDESSICNETRNVIEQVNWECDVRTNFSNDNMGCGVRVYTAINWALEQFEEVIILEDDCIATPSFFWFCQELLNYYRNDKRVMHISGNNFQKNESLEKYSYYFSKYTHAWGWATWRRAWKYFDWRIKFWPELKNEGLIEAWCHDPYEQRYWTTIFDKEFHNSPDVWDYKWNLWVWAQNGLVILPAVNLVTNIGYGRDATHTIGMGPYHGRQTNEITSIKHPSYILRNTRADNYTFDNNFGGTAMRYRDSWQAKVKRFIRLLTLPLRAVRKLYRVTLNLFSRVSS